MEIVVFTDGGSHVVTAPDGTLQWQIYKGDGKEDVAEVKMFEYRELSIHKFAYVALFREAYQGEITEAILKYGYDV
ncbi:hypothetical protein JDT53_12630 [Escherichia coli]|nr:hypothetical protein [Escherichia coli]EJS6324250.1 hypothetical protein [Escherichia coli]EKM0761525.1 hypothetical protein [Escherichia coli]EKQ6353115.1 hypothetical protein [Escherichia coli]ELI4584662.1 hypothetical protein [Escherichia coli]